jgi:hypothetical protein
LHLFVLQHPEAAEDRADLVGRLVLVVIFLRRLDVDATMPALSCSRRSFSALTRLAIGSRTVVAA